MVESFLSYALSLDHLQRCETKEDGSSGLATVGGALRPTGGAPQSFFTRTSESHFEGEDGDFGDVEPVLDSVLCERTRWPYAGEAEGKHTFDASCASEVSDAVYTDDSECSGSVGRRR